MATHSSVFVWRIPGTGEPGGLPSMGLHRVGHNWSNLAAAAAALQVYICVCTCMCLHAKPLQLCSTLCTLWTVARQAALSTGFFRQESGVDCRALLQGYSQPSDWTKSLLSTCISRWVLYRHRHLGGAQELSYYPAIPLLGKYPEEIKFVSWRDIGTLMFTAALFTIVNIQKLVKCPLLDIHIRKMWDWPHNGVLFSLKRKTSCHSQQCIDKWIWRILW